MKPIFVAPDVRYLPEYFGLAGQRALLNIIRNIIAQAPLYHPTMPRTGKKMSVRMSNCGPLGWVSDQAGGYRYQAMHPISGDAWPAMPEELLKLWQEVSGHPTLPQACLINFYDAEAKMGLHQDRDEEDFSAPVVSISLGDDCRFRIGGTTRGGATKSVRLKSGDVIVLEKSARLAFHGVDRIYSGTSQLLRRGGRINLTLRRVTASK